MIEASPSHWLLTEPTSAQDIFLFEIWLPSWHPFAWSFDGFPFENSCAPNFVSNFKRKISCALVGSVSSQWDGLASIIPML
jgi:hypothetical protein